MIPEIKAKKVGCIVATTLDGYIGYQNDLMITALINRLITPERLSAQAAKKMDMEYFQKITTGENGAKTSVIMGRKTWESLPTKYRPLKNRINIVITSKDLKLPEGVLAFRTIDEALEAVEVDEAWLIGGAGIYDEGHRFVHEVHICKYQFHASDVMDAHELRSGSVSIPDWMKDPTDHYYEKSRTYVPDSWQRYEVEVYKYVQT